MKKQNGFTLIELVVVIAILGILAAVALPRFMNATKDAHRSAVAGTTGALSAAVLLARAQFEINRGGGTLGCETDNCQQNVRGFGNGDIDVNANGWAIGTGRTDGAGATVNLTAAHCVQVFEGVLQGTAPVVSETDGDNVQYVTASGTGTAANGCRFTYQPDGGDDVITYNADLGEVTYTFN
ncbi:type II secretion system protein [Pseudomonas sp. NPDC047963]